MTQLELKNVGGAEEFEETVPDFELLAQGIDPEFAVKTVKRMAKEYYRKENNIPKSVRKVYNDYS